DFGFSFPFEPEYGYLGGKSPTIESVFDLWSLIEQTSLADSDFGCSGFINHPNYADLFWKSGRQPETWIDRKRRTERVCADLTKTRPDTLYKLIGSKQVG